jgi:hypothetical protein
MSEWAAIVAGELSFLIMFALTKTKLYSEVSSNFLVFFLLLFFFGVLAYFINKAFSEVNDNKSKKKRGGKIEANNHNIY